MNRNLKKKRKILKILYRINILYRNAATLELIIKARVINIELEVYHFSVHIVSTSTH